MLLGVTGAGKSCLGNFLLGKEGQFPESKNILKSETKTASCGEGWEKRICLIDTPGLGDTQRLGKHESKAMDIAEDASYLITELTKMMLSTCEGISAFLVVIPANVREHSGTLNLLDLLEILGNYWGHSILVLMHGRTLGETEPQQYHAFQSVLYEYNCPPIWGKFLSKVNNRYVIIEGKDWRNDANYRHRVLKKLLSFSEDITNQHGPYRDDLNSIGNKAFEKAKLELCDSFEDLESPEAREAIFKSACEDVNEVILKLVRIKLADGEDVDKLKKMNALKASELEKLHKQTDNLIQKYEKEKEQRRKEEKKRIQAERAQHIEEKKRKQAEQAQRMEEKKRKQAESRNIKAEDPESIKLLGKQLDIAQRERQEAERQKIVEMQKREQAVREKLEAEIQMNVEKNKRENIEKEKKHIEQQRRDEMYKRQQAEESRTLAEHERDEERNQRKRAELETKQERDIREQALYEKQIAEQQKNIERERRQQTENDKSALEQEKEKETIKRQRAEEEVIKERDRREQMEMKKRDAEKCWEEEKDRRKQIEETVHEKVRQNSEAWRNRGILNRLLNRTPSSDW